MLKGFKSATTTEDNAAITLTIGGDDEASTVLTKVTASFDGTVAGATLQIQNEADEDIYVASFDDKIDLDFVSGLWADKGEEFNLLLTASGTGGTSGHISAVYKEQRV